VNDASIAAVRLAPGVEDAGLASMLADLVRLNLARDPRKRADFARLDAAVLIEARDAEVAVTLEFSQGSLTVHAGSTPAPRVSISADSETILELARLKIVLGLPMVFGGQGRALLRKLIDGTLRISPLRGNLGMLLRLTRLLSVFPF
jgi:hypothetical protein